VQLRDAYARVHDGEMWLHGMNIAPYSFASGRDGHDPERVRKLLLHREEIDELGSRVAQERLALVPLAVYFKENRIKVELAVARGRKRYDKRQALAKADASRDIAREMGRRAKGRPSE
jgi:SsrA-binding protein